MKTQFNGLVGDLFPFGHEPIVQRGARQGIGVGDDFLDRWYLVNAEERKKYRTNEYHKLITNIYLPILMNNHHY